MKLPITCKWDTCAGYDCMTAGWEVRDAEDNLLFVVDEAKFNTAKEAEYVAKFIVDSVNHRQTGV